MREPVSLTLEQKFLVASFQQQIQNISVEESKLLLVRLYEQMLAQQELYKSLIKKEWGLENG
jgi:hypothetical protein